MNAIDKPAPARTTAVESTPAPDTRNLHQRLLGVMLDVQYIQKDRTIGSYKVVTHDAVTAKVRPALVKHGVIYYPQNLVYVQNGNRTELSVDIKFVNAADPADFICVPSLGYGIDASDKGPGKALSYAVKMALLKALGLETGEDADDNTNVEHAPPDYTTQKNAPGVSAAKTRMREIVRELNSIADEDQFTAYLPEIKDFCVEVCGKWPGQWIGPEEGSGLKGQIQVVGKQLGLLPALNKWLGKVEASVTEQAGH